MFFFIIKKNFCDGWDNLISVIITNLVFLFTGIGLVLLNGLAVKPESTILTTIAFTFSLIVLSILTFAYSDTAAHIANFDGISLLDFFKAIPGVLKDATLFGIMNSVVILVSNFSIRYYIFEMKSMVGFAFGCIMIWMFFFYILAMQWFIPIRGLMHNNFKKCLKKSFIILFDNTGFTLACALYNLILIALSVLCIGFFPSMSGILIANTNALRILLYKYDYLEEHSELQTKKERRRIPWDTLLEEDRQMLGPRNFRSFIFPWKDDKVQDL